MVMAHDYPPLTVDTIRRAMLGMPPRQTWFSSRLFPADRAIVVDGAGEQFTCTHPSFWLQIGEALRKAGQTKLIGEGYGNPVLTGILPLEIDPWASDSLETAKWRAAHWDRLRDAFEVAMVELLDWLRPRSAPAAASLSIAG